MESSLFYLFLALSFFVYLSCHFMPLDQYMDEIFHIPQANAYCRGDFNTWDPKITTFPGLYFFSFAASTVLRWIECTPTNLRALNFSLSCVLPILLYKCNKKLNRGNKYTPVLLYLYPLSSFYYFLFYTDTISVVSFFVCYTLVLSKYSALSNSKLSLSFTQQLLVLMTATICLLTRQTNVVWLLFLAGTTMLQEVKRMGVFQYDECSLYGLASFAAALWTTRNYLLYITWPLLLPVVGFVVFLVVNGSIVLGDKENHQAGIHPAMMAHCCLLYTVMSLPSLCTCWAHYCFSLPSSSIIVKENNKATRFWMHHLQAYFVPNGFEGVVNLMIMIIGGSCFFFGSKAHPFLLADNRHYMFYIWNRWLQYPIIRMLLTPLYALATLFTVKTLYHSKQTLWTIIFFIAVALTLLPTPLLEPRYFTQSVLVGLLNSSCLDGSMEKSFIFEVLSQSFLVLLMLVNGVLAYIFVYRPFVWPDGSVARFMF